MRLVSIRIRNFQNHKDLFFKFDKRVTVIVGMNDRGKSAILRALRLVCFNRPVGKAYVRKGTTQCTVTIKTNKHTIIRKIGKANTYSLDGEVYKSFGTKVPEAIQQVLNLQEINFQLQHEPVFWFSLSSGQVAKELNKLIDLDSIDRMQSKAAKLVKTKQTILDISRQRLQAAKDSRNALQWVRSANVKLGKLEAAQASMAAQATTTRSLALLVDQATEHGQRLKRDSWVIPAALVAVASGAVVQSTRKRLERLGDVIRAVGASQRAIIPVPSGFDQLSTRFDQLKRQRERIDGLSSIISTLVDQENNVCLTQKRLVKRQQRLEKLLNGRCPVCGGLLTSEMKMY